MSFSHNNCLWRGGRKRKHWWDLSYIFDNRSHVLKSWDLTSVSRFEISSQNILQCNTNYYLQEVSYLPAEDSLVSLNYVNRERRFSWLRIAKNWNWCNLVELTPCMQTSAHFSCLNSLTVVRAIWCPSNYGSSTRGLFCIWTRSADAYRASAGRKWDTFANPSMLGFVQRRTSDSCLPFAARYQCVPRRHKEDCLVIELAHDDSIPFPIKRSNSLANSRMEARYNSVCFFNLYLCPLSQFLV